MAVGQMYMPGCGTAWCEQRQMRRGRGRQEKMYDSPPRMYPPQGIPTSWWYTGSPLLVSVYQYVDEDI